MFFYPSGLKSTGQIFVRENIIPLPFRGGIFFQNIFLRIPAVEKNIFFHFFPFFPEGHFVRYFLMVFSHFTENRFMASW